MGAFGWSRTPDENGRVDASVPSYEGLAGRLFSDALRGLQAGVRRLSDDQGGALDTAGSGDAYTLQTASGLTELRRGVSLLAKIHADNTGPSTLKVDDLAPLPVLDASGAALAQGQISAGRFTLFVLDRGGGGAWTWIAQTSAASLADLPGVGDLVDDLQQKIEQADAQIDDAQAAAATIGAQIDVAVAAGSSAFSAASQAAIESSKAASQAALAQAAAGTVANKQDGPQVRRIDKGKGASDLSAYAGATLKVDANGYVFEILGRTGAQTRFDPALDARLALKQSAGETRKVDKGKDRGVLPAGTRVVYTDANGYVVKLYDATGVATEATTGGVSASSFTAAEIQTHNVEAQQRSAAIQSRPIGETLQRALSAGFSQILLIGQSLSAAAQMFGRTTALSTGVLAGTLMIGTSERPDETNTRRFLSAGGAHFDGTISGTTLTITAVEYGVIKAAPSITGTGVVACALVSQLTSTEPGGILGGRGTYQVSVSQTVSSITKMMLAGTRDDALRPLRGRPRRYEPENHVITGGTSQGSPPYSDDPLSPWDGRLIGYERPSLGLSPAYTAVREFRRLTNRRAYRGDDYAGEPLVLTNAGVGATGLHEWRRMTAANNYDNARTYLRGERIRDASQPYGAWTLQVGSSQGNPPPSSGTGNEYWVYGTDCFNRAEEAAALLKAIVGSSVPTCLLATIMLQGTNDSGRTTRAAYASGLLGVIADVRSAIETGIHGQTKPGAFLIYSERVNQRGFLPFTGGSTTVTTGGWVVGTTYAKEQVVLYKLEYWISLVDSNTGNEPTAAGSTAWARLSCACNWSAEVATTGGYAAYDYVTVEDAGYYAKVNPGTQPPLVNGSLNAAFWGNLPGQWTIAGIAVDDAKLDVAKADPTVFHIGAGYAFIRERLVHGSVNWGVHAGLYLAKVLDHVLNARQGWMPLHCYDAIVKGRQILLKFHVPVGELQFRSAYMGSNPRMLPHRGVSVYDDAAPLLNGGNPSSFNPVLYAPSRGFPIGSYPIEKVGSHTLMITLPRDRVGLPVIAFGDPGRSFGITNIWGSQAPGAGLNYNFEVSPDMGPEENIPALNGKPFDLADPCVQHTITARAA